MPFVSHARAVCTSFSFSQNFDSVSALPVSFHKEKVLVPREYLHCFVLVLQDRENCRICLYVNTTKYANDSPTVISKCLSGLGFLVTTVTTMSAARKLSRNTHYSLVVLEDCRERKFIKDIK